MAMHRSLTFLFAVALLACDSVSFAAEDSRPDVSSLPPVPETIHDALQNRDYPVAVERIDEQLAKDDVEHADYLLYLKARAQTAGSMLEKAMATFEQLEKDFPKSRWLARSRFGRADVLVQQRNYQAAGLIYQAEAKRLLSSDRRDELARIYLEFADRYFEGVKADDPSGNRKPDYQQALTYYQESLKLNPALATRQRVELRIAHSQRELGKHNEAIAAYSNFLSAYAGEDTKADRKAPAAMEVQARYQLGRTQLAASQFEAARRTWQDFLASDVGKAAGGDLLAEATYRLAHTWQVPAPPSVPDLELGVAAHQRFLKAFPKHDLSVQVVLEIAQSWAHHGRYEQAVTRLTTLIQNAPDAKQTPLARNLLGQALASQKKFAEAIAAWREFLARHPSDPNWSNVQRVVINTEYVMAEVQRAETNYEAARTLWETFLNKYPLDPRAPQILFLFGQMKSAEGLKLYAEQIEAAGDEKRAGPIAPKVKARRLFEAAIADWQRVVSKYPSSEQASQAAFVIGATLEDQLGQLADALKAYKKVQGQYHAQAQQRIQRLTANRLEIVSERKFHSDEAARIKVTTRNIENVSVRIYRIDMVDYFRKMHLATGVEALDIALIDPDKTWDHKIAGFEEYRRIENEIEIPTDGPGVTAVTITGEKLEATTMVVVSDLDIIVKSSRNELFVFAQNSRTGKPQTDVSLLISDGEQVIAEELTGKDGVFQKSFEQLKTIADLRIFAVHEGHAASTVSNLAGLNFAVGLSPKGYLFTDRPAYRAGQLVNLKGIIRWVAEDRYVFKSGEQYQLDVYDARERLIHSRKIALNNFGALAANFELPESSPEGDCRVHLHQPGGEQSYETSFPVHEYRLESMRLELETPRQVYYRGDTIKGTISLKYYYGTPLAGKTIQYQLAGGRQHSATTDAKGEIAFEFPTRRFRESQELELTATFPEKNLNAATSLQLATRGFAINVSTLRQVYISGETFDATINVSDPAGEPVATDLTLEVIERTRVNGRRGERTVETFEIKSNEKGTVQRTLRVDKAGTYIVRVSGTDQFDNRLSGSHSLTISGDDDRIRLRLLADRHQYQVGDEASIRLHWREEPALALITYEGASILGYQLVSLKKGSNKLTVPMASRLAPNFNLAVAVMHGNRFHQTGSEFRVARKLNITLKPEQDTLKPGEDLKVEITTTDPQGKPVSAEVSLGLVQKNLWQMFGDQHDAIDQFFGGGYREPQVRATSSCTFLYRPATRSVNEFLLAEQEREDLAGRNTAAMAALHDARTKQEIAGLVDNFNDLFKQRRYAEAGRIAAYANTIAPSNPIAVNMRIKAQIAGQIAHNATIRNGGEVRFDQLMSVEESLLAVDESLPQNWAGLRGTARGSVVINELLTPSQQLAEGAVNGQLLISGGEFPQSIQPRGRRRASAKRSIGDSGFDPDEALQRLIEQETNGDGWLDAGVTFSRDGRQLLGISEHAANFSLIISQSQNVQLESVASYFTDLSRSEKTIVALNGKGEFQVVNGLPVAALHDLVGDGLQILPRMASAELGYWNPTIVTDEDGKATITFRLPERSTAWTLKSRGINSNALTGQAEVDIVSKKDLFGEIRTPLAFTDGDKATVLIEVHNSTVKKNEPIEVVLKTTIGERTTEIRRPIKSSGPGVEEIAIPVEVVDGDSVQFELTVSSGELVDTSRQAVPISPYGVPVFATTSGTSAQSTIVFVEHDKRLPVDDSRLELLIGPSIDRTLLEAVLGSSITPWHGGRAGGFERSISDVLGGVSLLKMIRRSRAADSPEVQALTARVSAGVARLVSCQRDDGAWSWSGRHAAESDRYLTSRAVWALSLARRGGFSIPADTLEKAVASLKSAFTNSSTSDREGQAIILHGLAQAGAADFAFANRLYRERNSLTASGLLHVALTLIQLDRNEMAADLFALVGLKTDPATVDQSDAAVLGCIPWMRTRVELHALHLLALEELYPEDKSTEQAADWLLAARRGFRWNPEKANGPAVMALAEWFSRAKFESEKYTLTVQVNDKDVDTLEIDPAVDATRQVAIPAELLVDGKSQKISLQLEGRGRFSYSAVLSGAVPADQLKTTADKWRVTRYREPAHRMLDGVVIPRGFGVLMGNYQYFRNPLTQLPVGERAEVTLQVSRNGVKGTKNEQLDYLVINEPLPAGTNVLRESIRGAFERYEIGPGAITFYIGDQPHPGPIQYTLVGHLAGNYRTVPTVVRSFYHPDQIAIAAANPLQVLEAGKQTVDEYRLTPVELYQFGKRLFGRDDFAAAGQHLTDLFKNYRLKDDIYKETVQMLFRTALVTDQHQAIVEYFEIIKEKYPDVEIDFDAIMLVATAYQELGEYERGYLVFRATIEGAFERESQIAGFLDDRDEFVRSVEVLERLLHEYPAESYVSVATFALAAEVYGKAAEAGTNEKLRSAGITRVDLIASSTHMHDHLLSTWPTDPASDRVSFSLANAVLDLEQYEQAIARCEKSARRYPNSPLLDSFWYVIGYSQFALGNHDAALKMCKQVSEAVRKDERTGIDVEAANKWQAVYIMGQIYHSLGQPAEAIAEYERVKSRFSDATEAIQFFTRQDIRLPEITTVKPGDDGKVELQFRNVKEASVKVYRIDLLKFGLMQRSLSRITAINLAGIRPYHEMKTKLGDGNDFRDRKQELKLPLKEEGAYLVVCRGENLYTSGLVLVSPLKLEIQEDATSGRVRVTVKDSGTDRYLRNVLVKVIGSANKNFNTGETDLRGIFVADAINGTSTIIARADEDRYAFYRGATSLGHVEPEASAAPQKKASSSSQARGEGQSKRELLQNLFDSNGLIQIENRKNYRQLLDNKSQGVRAKTAF